MKKNLFLTLMLSGFALLSIGQTFEIRTTEGDEGYLYVQMRETSGTGTPQTSNSVTDIVFQIKWLQSMGNVDLGSVICTNYEITKSGTRASFGAYYYQEYFADNTPYAFPENWTQNTWVTIAKMEVATGTGSGTFEVGDNAFVPTGVNIGVNLIDYTPAVNGSVTDYLFPTNVYNYVWVGGNGFNSTQKTQWERSGNWRGTCVGDAPPEDMYPYIGQGGSNVFIPAGLTYYPATTTGNDDGGWATNNLYISDGAQITVPDLASSTTNPELNINGKLIVDGTLNLLAKGHATVTGSTTINSAAGIIIQSDATGTGSFIDNGTITYGGSGSAKVQTYLANSAGVGNFDIHLVGPTLDQENYTGAGTGAFLEEFILDGAPTYAYEWDESVPNTADAWVNLNSLTDEIYSAMGIGLSTIDNTNHTLEMTGELITGNVSSPALTFSNNHYELISNPYPSAIDFDALYTANSGVVNNKFYLWNPAGNSWVEYAGGAGGAQFIQVGQGFFVETHTGGTFDFTNNERTHSTVAFRETMANILNVKVEGGMAGYQDDIVVRFDEEATSGYDINMEAEFWASQNPDATSLRSMADGNIQLAINVLPLQSLYSGDMLSVPLIFTCGYTAEYSLTFTDVASFDLGIEIWLEDKLTGGDWISINNQPEYIFNASPEDASDRFVLHFFGPTGTEELAGPTIDLYSFGQYAYVRNNTEEAIKEIRIYSLSGALMNQAHTPDQKFLKLWVDDQMAYYVITVITDQQVYTKKLFISK